MKNESGNELGIKVAELLNSSATELKQGTVYRLQQARQRALERHIESKPLWALAWAGAGRGTIRSGRFGLLGDVRVWLGTLALIASVWGYREWQHSQNLSELEEIDSALLSSELPVDAYLDKGFANWLTGVE